MNVLPRIQAAREQLVALRHDLHAHPELAFDEHRTAGKVADFLSARGIETHRGLAGTGVVGVLRRGDGGRAIALRADMDALPVHELNLFPHRSRHEGRMHACGWERRNTLPRTVASRARWCSSSSPPRRPTAVPA
ncbi:MAG: hipO [bacterium]|nr:MAG: hipO [bacterium]